MAGSLMIGRGHTERGDGRTFGIKFYLVLIIAVRSVVVKGSYIFIT